MNQLAPGSLLGQLAPANTTAATLVAARTNFRAAITSVVICNTTGTAATCRLFHDVGGTTYAASNALLYDVSVAANTTLILESGLNEDGLNLAPADTLGCRTGTGNALTFSAYGVIQAAR